MPKHTTHHETCGCNEVDRLIAETIRLDSEATQGPWVPFNVDDPSFMNVHGVTSDAPGTDILHERDAPDYGDIDPNRTVCLTLLQDPRAACHRSWKWDENAELIAAFRQSAPRLALMVREMVDFIKTNEDKYATECLDRVRKIAMGELP